MSQRRASGSRGTWEDSLFPPRRDTGVIILKLFLGVVKVRACGCVPLTHHLGGDLDFGKIMRPGAGLWLKWNPRICDTTKWAEAKDKPSIRGRVQLV